MLALLFAAGLSMIFTLALTPIFARTFRRMNLGQFIRADTPTTHVLKRGTPTMGGVIFITGALVGYFGGHLLGGGRPSASALLVILMMVGVGFIGFIDDFMKVSRHNSLGLAGPFKILGTVIVAIVFAILALTHEDSNGVNPASTAVSFVRDLPFDFVAIFGGSVGVILFVAWIAFITTSVSNAVNLTDGLDGLAAGASIFAIGSYIIIGFWQNQQNCLGKVSRKTCSSATRSPNRSTSPPSPPPSWGSLIGFLWWNTSPAQVMMGDTGAFALGGALAALAILSRTELLLALIGGLFVMVTGSVILQRGYFKLTKGKRIWRATPIHHHFEMKGWPEVTIVVRFWIISGLFVAAGVGIFYLEWVSRVAP